MSFCLKQLLDTCNRTMLITNISARFLFLSFLYSSSPFLSCPCSSYSCLIYRSSSYRLLNKQIIHCLKKKKKTDKIKLYKSGLKFSICLYNKVTHLLCAQIYTFVKKSIVLAIHILI